MDLFNHMLAKGLKFLKTPRNAPQNKTAKTPSVAEDPAGFMVSVIRAQTSLYKKEIANWQAARAAALNADRPRRKQITELFDEMLQTDAVVIAEANKRIDRVLNKGFKVTEYGSQKENRDKTDLFNKAWFYDWMRYKLQHLFYGHSLIYVKAVLDGRIKEVDIVDRRHVVPELGGFLPDLSKETIVPYTEPPFSDYCFPTGKPGQLGLLDAAAPLYILRKHSWASWDQFEEMFGVPIRIAKTASQDPRAREAIGDWLRDLGSAAHAVFPRDTELEIRENGRSDAFEVFDRKRRAANEELALLINSQAETSNNSGSRAKAEVVVESTQEQTTRSDLRFLYFEVNDKLMPVLAKLGYPINPEMDVFQWDSPEDLEEKLAIFRGVGEMGFELDPAQVEEVFNVKILGKKEVLNPFQTPFDPPGPQRGSDAPKK